MQAYLDTGLTTFLVLTVGIGGGAAWMTGRALAASWRPVVQPVVYTLLLAAVVRFFHYALYGGVLLSVEGYAASAAVLVAAALLGYRITRASQMVTQYSWLYERAGPLAWRKKERR